MRIIVFGDIHMNIGPLEVVRGIESAGLLIITGDITNFGFRGDAEKMIEKLSAVNPAILGVAGNLDQPDVADYLEEKNISLHGRGRMLGRLGLVGLGGSNYTPFNTPYEFSEPELANLLNRGYSQIENVQDHILVSHTPPYKTKTDRLHDGRHVGSSAVRSYIEQHQPLLCLTGHIHESRGQDSIGRTRILNPGMLKDGGYIEVLVEQGSVTAALCSCLEKV